MHHSKASKSGTYQKINLRSLDVILEFISNLVPLVFVIQTAGLRWNTVTLLAAFRVEESIFISSYFKCLLCGPNNNFII